MNFDGVAKYYDRLANIVFGGAVADAQLHFLDQVEDKGSVLVLGGGTGWWLRKFLDERPNVQVVFVEASGEMLRRAWRGTGGHSRILFIHGTLSSLAAGQTFDAVITFFFLDLFDQAGLSKEVIRIRALLKPGALWLASDFVKERRWHRLMLKLMYAFFSRVAGLSTRQLPDWEKELAVNKLREIGHKYFWHGFIKAGWYRLS